MSLRAARFPTLGLVLLLILCCAAPASAQRRRRPIGFFQEQHAELRAEFRASLDEVAAWCAENGFPDEAKRIRTLADPVVDEGVIVAESLPRKVQSDLPADLPAKERYWRTQLRRIRGEYATDLYLLSRRALHGGHPSYAYDLVQEVLRHDPDHRTARRLLGYVRYGDEWMTPFEKRMQRSHVWHDRFGWLRKSHVDRYERGERYFKGRWISAEQEAELRRDFRNAWEVRTDHYLVKTNHSLEQGVKIAQVLEIFHGFFHQTFAGFFATPQQMQKLFAGSGSRSRSLPVPEPHLVHFYRTKGDYQEALRERFPRIGITNGLYLSGPRTAYFYYDPTGENATSIFHEATHQLFYESERRQREVAMDAHFWIIEGIACYMESFIRKDGRLTVGDPDYIRFEAARYRYLNDGYYVPLAEFAAHSMRDFQTSQQIAKNYSQASGLAHFFMHYDDGRYRDALVEHLSQLYSGRRRPQSLPALTGVSAATLDRQYGEYLERQQAAIEAERVSSEAP